MATEEFGERVRRAATGPIDESLVARIDEAVTVIAYERHEDLSTFATENLCSTDGLDRLIAVIALGRVVELVRDDEVPGLASVIRSAIESERDRQVAIAMSSALVHAWARLDATDHLEEIAAASSNNVGVRLAAAKSLALTTAPPLEPEVARAVTLLLADPEPIVAEWAREAVDQPDVRTNRTMSESDEAYYQRIEQLANDICDAALEEGWLSYDPDPEDASPLQRSVNELARSLRHVHHADDGCFEDETADPKNS